MQPKYSSKQTLRIRGILVGCIIAMITTIILIVVVTLLILKQQFSEEIVQYIPGVNLLLSSIAGALVTLKVNKTKNLLNIFLTNSIYYSALLCTGVLFFNSTFNGAGIGALVVLCSSLAVSLVIRYNYKNNNRGRGHRNRIVQNHHSGK